MTDATKPRKPRTPMSPEAKAAWKASVMKNNNKPARGGPAMGAKVLPDVMGRSDKPQHEPFNGPVVVSPERRAYLDQKKLDRAEALERAYLIAADVMENGAHPLERLAGATKLKEWIEGTSVQRTITADISDADKLIQIEFVEGKKDG